MSSLPSVGGASPAWGNSRVVGDASATPPSYETHVARHAAHVPPSSYENHAERKTSIDTTADGLSGKSGTRGTMSDGNAVSPRQPIPYSATRGMSDGGNPVPPGKPVPPPLPPRGVPPPLPPRNPLPPAPASDDPLPPASALDLPPPTYEQHSKKSAERVRQASNEQHSRSSADRVRQASNEQQIRAYADSMRQPSSAPVGPASGPTHEAPNAPVLWAATVPIHQASNAAVGLEAGQIHGPTHQTYNAPVGSVPALLYQASNPPVGSTAGPIHQASNAPVGSEAGPIYQASNAPIGVGSATAGPGPRQHKELTEEAFRLRIKWSMFVIGNLLSAVVLITEMSSLRECDGGTEIAYHVSILALVFTFWVELLTAVALSRIYRSPLDIKSVYKIPPSDIRNCGGSVIVNFVAPFSWAVIYFFAGDVSLYYSSTGSCRRQDETEVDWEAYFFGSGAYMKLGGLVWLVVTALILVFMLGSALGAAEAGCCTVTRRRLHKRFMILGPFLHLFWQVQAALWVYHLGGFGIASTVVVSLAAVVGEILSVCGSSAPPQIVVDEHAGSLA